MVLHRVVTYNVRRFSHGKDKLDTVDLIIQRLRPLLPISLLALNEVDVALRPHALGRLSDALGLEHSEFFGHVASGNYGNALLSAAPLLRRETHHLDGGTVVKSSGAFSPKGQEHRIVRGLLTAYTHIGGVPVGVGVTHLDHMQEAERVIQARHVLRAMLPAPRSEESDDGASQLLLLGDLNALSRADYSPAQWAQHEQHNAQRGWGSPSDSGARDGCVGILRTAGFEDCVRLALMRGSATAADASGAGDGATGGVQRDGMWSAPPWSAHVHARDGPRYRIDYVLSRPPPRGSQARLACVSARVANVTDDGGQSSDHCPVAVDFEVVQAQSSSSA